LSALKVCPVCSTEYPANERFCPRDGTALRTQGGAADLVGTVIAERYHVLKKLGEGGMGQVYLAEHVKMGRKSAVKVMNPGMVQNVDAISRFNREASNASRINHPNVAGIYDFGESEGLIYLAMEFVEGQPLTDIIKHHGALPPMRASEIARQTAEGLTVAHDMGIVHRDLKPDNIMIAKGRNGADLVKVVDFGIAKAAASDEQKVTKTGMVVGTPEYMSPEQLSGDPLDARSDIYALGLMTFNMLTGKLPFPGESMQETMIMRLTDDPRPLGEMKPDVVWPAELQRVMDKALARRADERYRNASEFAHDLVQAIDRMPATSITAMGTQIVRPSDAARAAAAATAATIHVEVPKTRIGTKEEVSRPASSPAATPTKSKTPIFAGIGVLAAAGIAAAMFLKPGGGKSTSDSADSTVTPVVTTPVDSSGTVAASGQPQPVQLNNRIPVIVVADTLSMLKRLFEAKDDSASAMAIIERVTALNPKSAEDRVQAATLLHDAHLASTGDKVKACLALRAVQEIAPGTTMARSTQDRLSNCQ
jgi:serine/threonine protein kinase